MSACYLHKPGAHHIRIVGVVGSNPVRTTDSKKHRSINIRALPEAEKGVSRL